MTIPQTRPATGSDGILSLADDHFEYIGAYSVFPRIAGGASIRSQWWIITTSRVPVEGKLSVCLICMKYRIISFIIIIISLGQMLISYIANTSRTHAPTHPRTHAHTHRCARTCANACTPPPHPHSAVAVSLFDGSVPANREGPYRW